MKLNICAFKTKIATVGWRSGVEWMVKQQVTLTEVDTVCVLQTNLTKSFFVPESTPSSGEHGALKQDFAV